jgi:thiosulfate reductase cytochrome b subunit
MPDLPQTSGEPSAEQAPPVPLAPPVAEVSHEAALASEPTRVYRHALPVRIGHWINVLCLPILIMSGLQIFNAHPALYWGDRSDRDRPILAMRAVVTESGERKGVTTVWGHPFDTTGLLGYSSNMRRGFPSWATLPGPQWLAMGRRWHLFFAWVFVINGLLFGLYAVLSRHLTRDLFPWWKDLRGLGRALLDHLLFRHPAGEEAKRYNVLQKIAYTAVIFGLGPLIVLTGLSMSPMIDAAFPSLLTLFGGRQAARTLHFVACFAFIGFIVFHLLMVAITGLWNNLRSMLTGWFAVAEHEGLHDEQPPH